MNNENEKKNHYWKLQPVTITWLCCYPLLHFLISLLLFLFILSVRCAWMDEKKKVEQSSIPSLPNAIYRKNHHFMELARIQIYSLKINMCGIDFAPFALINTQKMLVNTGKKRAIQLSQDDYVWWKKRPLHNANCELRIDLAYFKYYAVVIFAIKMLSFIWLPLHLCVCACLCPVQYAMCFRPLYVQIHVNSVFQ